MRDALGLLALTAACAAPPTTESAARAEGAAPAPRRPNVLVIVADDLRHDALGVVQREQGERGRFPWLATPHLDRLASEGARLREAFVVNSLCSPSRASLLTGRYPHAVGVLDNRTPFPLREPNFGGALRDAGYATAYIGKWHMGRQSGARPGFDYSASYAGQGEYFDCPFEIQGRATPTQGWVDDVATELAERFLREPREQPFLVVLGFKSTHFPYEAPERRRGQYEGVEPRPTPNLDTAAAYAHAKRPTRRTLRRQQEEGEASAPENRFNHGYFETLAALDDNVGRLLAVLDELDLARDTLVVFTSDNGMYLGEHGLKAKRSAYEESLRVPFVVRYPRSIPAGARVGDMALTVDLAPTLLDFAGVEVPERMQGRSLRAALEGRPLAHGRRSFFYGYVAERGFAAPTVTAVRTTRHKLVVYPGHDDWTELFDLSVDPYEIQNLATREEAAQLLEQLRAEHARLAAEVGFPREALEAPAGLEPDDADDPDEEHDEHGEHEGGAKDGPLDGRS